MRLSLRPEITVISAWYAVRNRVAARAQPVPLATSAGTLVSAVTRRVGANFFFSIRAFLWHLEILKVLS